MFPTISYVYNDVGDRKSFYETDRVFFHSGVCQIGHSTVLSVLMFPFLYYIIGYILPFFIVVIIYSYIFLIFTL